VERINTDGERAQVELLWDERCKPRCGQCGQPMRINRKTRQGATDLPLATAGFMGVVYEAVQGYCRHCARYETVRPLEIRSSARTMSDATHDSRPAAIAALRAVWAEVRAEAMRMQIAAEDGDALAAQTLPPLLDELWSGHERALRAIAIEHREELCALKHPFFG